MEGKSNEISLLPQGPDLNEFKQTASSSASLTSVSSRTIRLRPNRMPAFGNLFRSAEEQIEPIDAVISGNIPDWINGVMILNGPALFDLKDNFSVNHWLDGFAMVSKFHIQNGKVSFSKRFIESDAYIKGTSAGKPLFTEFGTKAHSDPNKNMFQKVWSSVLPELTDNVANNIYLVGKTLFASTDTSLKRIIDPKTLKTGPKIDVAKSTKLDLAASHVYFDSDGTGYALGRALSAGFRTQIFKIPPGYSSPGKEFSNATILATLPTRTKMGITFTHSLGITENHIIYIEQPMYIPGMKLIAAHGKGKSMLDCMEWKPEDSNRFIIINKSNGDVSSIVYESAKPFFFFHHINAYEQNGQIVVDLMAHESPEVIHKMALKELRASNFNLQHKSESKRFVLPILNDINGLKDNENLIKDHPKSITAVKIKNQIILTEATIAPPALEMPIVNPSFYGKPYTYFYGAGLYDQSKFRNKIAKIDVVSGHNITWNDSETSFPGEPLFLPSPNSSSEDDGVLLVNVTETKEGGNSFLVVLDAKDLTEIARASLSVHSPMLLHGVFIPEF